MQLKKPLAFVIAASISFVAAGYQWTDSSHTIGLISQRGGKVRHPAHLESGKSRYAQIITATVMPPYHGDARVVLEGSPPVKSEIHMARPIIPLGFRRTPRLEDQTLMDLQPGDRIALWLIMRPAPVENDLTIPQTNKLCGGKYALAMYDTKSGRPILRAPIVIEGKEDTDDNSCCY